MNITTHSRGGKNDLVELNENSLVEKEKKTTLLVSPEAEKRIRVQLEKRGKGLGLLIGTKSTGCSGLAYTIEFADEEHADLLKVTGIGYSIFMSEKTASILQGAILQYTKKGLNEGFTFENPNEKDRCGCGESFRV